MLRLKLLGGASLESEAGVIAGRAVQRRRLALLALLAAAPGRTLSRDKLIALLWPESTTEDARHLLSVTLHELRRLLGEGLLLTRGDDVVLSATELSTDAADFEAAVRGGAIDQAIGLYAGPFMDGVHVSDAQELEDWIQSERDRLSRLFAGALEDGARRRAAAGDSRGAIELWRRLAVHDPFNARVARELVLALVTAGDRAGALQHARMHATLMREEFGVEPDDDFNQLVETLRAPLPAQAVAGVSMPPPPVERSRRKARPVAAGLAILALLGAGSAILLYRPGDGTSASRASIAVLPFRNIGSSDSLDYFVDGLTEEVLLALGRVDSLEVIGRTSAFSLRDRDPGEVGRRLGVRNVLLGSVRTGSDRLKVTAALVDARNGKQIWTQSYEPPLRSADIVAVQEDIARAVVRELAPRLGGQVDPGTLVPAGTANLDAKRLYWNGRMAFERRTPEHLVEALTFFQRATRADPQYALAHAATAEVFTMLGAYDYGALPPRQAFSAARASAERALGIDAGVAEAHAALANVAFNYDWDWAAADRSFQRAIVLNKGYAPAYHWYALFLLTQGRSAEARRAILRAREVESLSPVIRTGLARQYYLSREYTSALEEYHRVIAQDSQFVTAHAGIGLTLAVMGRPAEALAHYRYAARIGSRPAPVLYGLMGHAAGLHGDRATALAQLDTLQQLSRRQYIPAEWFVLVYLGLRDHDQVFAQLERALEARSGALPYLAVEPVVDPIRADPRFDPLLDRLKLPRTPSR